MSRYFLLEKGGEGCDYSIGCGIRISELSANSLEEAKEAAWNGSLIYGAEFKTTWKNKWDGGSVNDVSLFVVEDLFDLNPYFYAKKEELNNQKMAKEQEAQKNREFDEFQRLKAKFEGKTP